MKKAAKKPAENKSETNLDQTINQDKKTVFNKLPWVIAAVILVAVLFVLKNPKMFLAATVNNRPVMVWDLNSQLQKKFASKILDQMIDELLIKEEAAKQKIQASEKEIAEKFTELEKQVGGKESLTQLLTGQGMTLDELNEQLRLKILVDKILTKSVTVSEKEIDEYIAKNKDALPSTDSATQKSNAAAYLKQQKLSDTFQKWYQDLKNKAKIYKFF